MMVVARLEFGVLNMVAGVDAGFAVVAFPNIDRIIALAISAGEAVSLAAIALYGSAVSCCAA